MCSRVCVCTWIPTCSTHTPPNFFVQQSIKRPSMRTARPAPAPNVGRGGSAESTHCSIVLAEKCDDRRDLSFSTRVWGPAFNERKVKPGSWICMKGLESNHEAWWALETQDLCAVCSRHGVRFPRLTAFSTSFCTCTKKETVTWPHRVASIHHFALEKAVLSCTLVLSAPSVWVCSPCVKLSMRSLFQQTDCVRSKDR